MKKIEVNLFDENSIDKAEKEKIDLENNGYKLIVQDIGYSTATLYYGKGKVI